MTRRATALLFLTLLGCQMTPDVPNARRPMDGLLTGGQPSAEQIERLAGAGYGTVINLRAADEPGFDWEAELVEQLGMRYVHIPVEGAAGLTMENVSRIDRELARALDEGPVLLHCGSGNRIGATLALRESWLRGKDAQASLELGLAAGLTRLEPAVREKLGLPAGE